jgi:hypothetical protein
LAAMIASGVVAYEIWTESRLPGLFIGGWLELLSLVFALVTWGILRSRMRPTNWIVRTHVSGISIKFRSYLNHHFDANDAIVVFLRYSEIEFVRAHRLRQDVPGFSRGDSETRYLRFSEFKLRDEDDLNKIAQELAIERSRKGPRMGRFIKRQTTNVDYPVQVTDGFLRVQWRVWPRLPQFMRDIAGQIAVRESLKTRDEFRALKSAPPKDQEDALLKLIGQGDRFGAIRLIKEIYSYDTTRAVQFLEELTKTEVKSRGSASP